MRVLFVAKQKKNVDTFETTIDALLARGHHVTLAIQQRDTDRDRRLIERFSSASFALASCPEERGDAWRRAAPLVRATRDWAQYRQPAYARAGKLEQRAIARLVRELGASSEADVAAWHSSAPVWARVREALASIEDAIPSDRLHEEFIHRHTPDVVLVSPGLHFGSGQSDFIKSARALGIPVWMLLFSWDNLSTKGALHVPPDRMFVWNQRQVQEAAELHGFPADRVTVVGAPRFDEFFALRSVVARDAFFEPLQLDPRQRTILYLCSSKFIADDEMTFVARWLAALRASASAAVRDCNVIIRPHPDVPLATDGDPDAITWSGLPQATAWVHRPFADARVTVVRTTYSTPQAFYECLHHADAVVALNTSAELEAGIAGRPVLTVLTTDQAADGQANTLHFDYLLREHGGFVRYAPDLATHERHLADTLANPDEASSIRTFVLEFLRPHGDRPVAPLLADALITAWQPGVQARAAHASGGTATDDLRLAAPPATAALAAKTLSVDGIADLGVLATAETRRVRERGVLRLEPAVARWLDEAVGPGDVVYDVGAGVGTYALVAAVKRGALVVAFEPGFAVFRTLCENVRLNNAAHSVIPLPLALSDRAGFFELEFSGTSGGEQHVLRNREWRSRRETDPARQGQPVCAERLDDVVSRYRIPAPTALRLNVRRGAERIMAGAAQLLAQPALRSICITVSRPEDLEPATAGLRSAGFSAGTIDGSDEAGYTMSLRRETPAAGGVWDRLRAAARRP